ncbi:MAG TPA: alpha-galactosidase [Tepidisphaeraceae bacterium]|jgi:alpha-galactosidase|nr:alpha-galactosidase [Tepidisphaeraceae bacterium]
MTDRSTAATATGPEDCYAHIEDADVLVVGNGLVERAWQVRQGVLTAVRLLDKTTGHQWAIATVPVGIPAPAAAKITTFETVIVANHPVSRPSLRVRFGAGDGTTYHVEIFPSSAGVAVSTTGGSVRAAARSAGKADVAAPSGVEVDAPAVADQQRDPRAADTVEQLKLDALHLRFTHVTLVDQTDVHDNLAIDRQWLLHPSKHAIELQGNLAFFEGTLHGHGLILLRLAPLPHARPVRADVDLTVKGGLITVLGRGGDGEGGGYPSVIIPYSGGRAGRIAALQRYQRQVRPYVAGRDARFLSNTWGDRSRDARIREDFMHAEIIAGQRLGAEVIQIDDGWQRGRTANSAEKGGVWNGFWASDARFWDAHPERLPNGLAPLVDAARDRGMKFGLWFAPDSSDDFANWERDADQILSLYREQGIEYVKIDGVKMHTTTGERNLRRFYDKVLAGSNGQVVFDHDVTAEVRPSYFGVIDIGTIFVENRYTDWRGYWPHHTLRNLWQLAQHVDPARLRMEFLNNARHAANYTGDPLAPACYAPDYLFATVMFASPLGWFEMSNLPESYFEKVAPLVAIWMQHRDAIFSGTIIPIGAAPDGTQWTGFVSRPQDGGPGGYALLFRELTTRDTFELDLSELGMRTESSVRLAGAGDISRTSGGTIRVSIPASLQYVFIQL